MKVIYMKEKGGHVCNQAAILGIAINGEEVFQLGLVFFSYF